MAKLKSCVPKQDVTGQRFGRLLVLRYEYVPEKEKGLWLCQCDCGNMKHVGTYYLIRGHTASCGCFMNEARFSNTRTHGHCANRERTPEYKIWEGMIARCTNPNNHAFFRYGMRGITVCERWLHSFENFFADMGKRPKGLSIERINNDGNYEPSNCKWATKAEQMRNRCCNVILEHDGKRMCQVDWAKELGVNYKTIILLLKTMTFEQIVTRFKTKKQKCQSQP